MQASIYTHPGYKVFDANNNEIKNVIFCDTKTGEVKQHIFTKLANDYIQCTQVTKTYPAPLRLEKIYKCKDCKDTGKYVGFNVVEKCKSCEN